MKQKSPKQAARPDRIFVALLLVLAAVYFLPRPIRGNLDQAVSQAILERAALPDSHSVTEAHHVLAARTDRAAQTVTVYLVASSLHYCTTDQGLKETGGFFGVPTALTFSKSSDGSYELETYWEARDGELYLSSIRETFPRLAYYKLLGYPAGLLTTSCEIQGWWASL